MAPHPLHVVDVFAERALEGNALAVVLEAGDLDGAAMQAIARETNLSETTFVTGREEDGAWRVRIFTPAAELPFAGHPTLGTAWVLAREAGAAEAGLVLSLGVGRVPVAFEAGVAWLEAPPVSAGPLVPGDALAAALGLAPDDVSPVAPCQQLSAGIGAIVAPLASADALARARLDLAAFAPLADAGHDPYVHVHCREPADPGNDLAARFFFPDGSSAGMGVREDPATGSATALLGAWLLEHRALGDAERLALRVEQGVAMGRPSLLHLEARRAAAGAVIRVGGRVVPVVRGSLL